MRKIAMLLACALLLTLMVGCDSGEAYVPTGNGLADATVATDPTEMNAPGSLNTEEMFYTLAYYPEEGFNPYLCNSLNNRMLFSLI
jgi:hypothetical protein